MMTAIIGLRVETVRGLCSLNDKKSYCTTSRILDSAGLGIESIVLRLSGRLLIVRVISQV